MNIAGLSLHIFCSERAWYKMKVLIAYKDTDSYEAMLIKDALLRCGAEVRDGAVDDITAANDRKLIGFVGKSLDGCTDVIVLVSNVTKHQWWVQLLIEAAQRKNMSAAVFLSGWSELPEYLSSARRLRLVSEVESFAAARMSAEPAH